MSRSRIARHSLLLCAVVPAPALADATRLGGGEPLEISLGRIVAALLVCLIIAGFAILLIRQRGGKLNLPDWFARWEIRPRAIEVVETRRLSQHADICVVRHGGCEYLLLLMSGDARVLSERAMDAAADPAGWRR